MRQFENLSLLTKFYAVIAKFVVLYLMEMLFKSDAISLFHHETRMESVIGLTVAVFSL